ncbi:ImmA/IrrE family metallo-endopeptidase [Paenibacillus motobuensis]|uniref:ImmA/IrrE family metallo-endopeptidase n=1 Tax=Paenibacillus motobuensis TaxID=295324 RepID=UPI0031CDC9D3
MEQWISTEYMSHGIMVPDQLDIDNIAEAFGVELIYEACPSFSDNEDKVIFLNKQTQELSARLIFFHELCHVMRHAGDQRRMPLLFKSAQETEAEQFVLYAAMPFYMMTRLNIPDQHCEAIPFIAEQFQVTLELAERRLDQVQRRVLQGTLIAAAREADRKQQAAESWSPETMRILDQLERQITGGKGGN